MAGKKDSKVDAGSLDDVKKRLKLAQDAAVHANNLAIAAHQLMDAEELEDSRAGVHAILSALEDALGIVVTAADEQEQAPYADRKLLACLDKSLRDGWLPQEAR